MAKGGQREALGRSRGGLSTKVHLVADAQGRPVRFSITGGQRADVSQALPLLTGIETGAVIADKGYESNRPLALIRDQGAEVVYRPSQTGGTLGNTTGNCTVSVTRSNWPLTNSSIGAESPPVMTPGQLLPLSPLSRRLSYLGLAIVDSPWETSCQ